MKDKRKEEEIKRYLMVLRVLVLSLLMCSVSALSLAQEEERGYSWGSVKSISSNQIVVSEYNFTVYEDTDVTYVINPEVKLEGVKSPRDIAVDDVVGIEYVVKDGQRVAESIQVEKLFQEEEFTFWGTDEEQFGYSEEEIW